MLAPYINVVNYLMNMVTFTYFCGHGRVDFPKLGETLPNPA